jgi:hypothetical protein
MLPSKLGCWRRRTGRPGWALACSGPPMQKESHDRGHCAYSVCRSSKPQPQHPCCLGFIWLPPRQSRPQTAACIHTAAFCNETTGCFLGFSRNYCDRSIDCQRRQNTGAQVSHCSDSGCLNPEVKFFKKNSKIIFFAMPHQIFHGMSKMLFPYKKY